ncbi:expressed unknown protein [Seminavis robusta]|uniref:Uncharacterized protein n=1 Tax=Seminavis robusta TaxID=568900 RepID=A0A9N8EAA0_9STRA|nr:expressed unknown protein [Seminavis robusta]|eukprot:Sro875_g214410.1 n/a (2218) ;mRNA; f:27632-34382
MESSSGSNSGGGGVGSDVDVMEAFGSFVLNVKVLGSDAGVGVPTLPVRIPQIMDNENQLSFRKLVEIVIMIASSQSAGDSSGNGSGNSSPTSSLPPDTRIQHHVLLSFPNPQTQNSVMISSAQELIQLMSRHQEAQQLTLIAKVQHDIVPKTNTSHSPTTTNTTEKVPLPKKQDSLKSPVRRPTLETDEDDLPTLSASSTPESEEQNSNVQQNTPASTSMPPKLEFDPPQFHIPTSNSASSNNNPSEALVMVNLMEQLLDIQTNRMQQFANHMEHRFGQMIEQKVLASQDTLKQTLRETVQLVADDDDSDDESSMMVGRPKAGHNNNHNLEKIVKDQMVSMELRFARLEEQSKQTAVLAKLPSPTRTTTTSSQPSAVLLEQMDARMAAMEQMMLAMRHDAQTTKNALLAAASSSNKQQQQQQRNNKDERSTLLLIPSLSEDGSAPLPHTSQASATTVRLSNTTNNTNTTVDRPVSPPTNERGSLLCPPPLMPLSPPTSLADRSFYSTGTDTGTEGTGNSTDEDDNNTTTNNSHNNNDTVVEGTPVTTFTTRIAPTADSIVSPTATSSSFNSASAKISALTMPSLNNSSSEEGSKRKKGKKTVRDMLAEREGDNNPNNSNEGSPDDDNKSNSLADKMPVSQLPFFDASARNFMMVLNTPPTSSQQFVPQDNVSSSVQAPPLLSPPAADAPRSSSTELKMKQAIKEHVQSMESRVSKLRELNRQQENTTPTTAATSTMSNSTTPGLLLSPPSTARTLFHDTSSSMDLEKVLETTLSEKMESLRQSLTSTLQQERGDTNAKLIEEWEDMLEQKLDLWLKQGQPGSSGHGPPVSPKRRSSFPDMQALEELVEKRIDGLEDLLKRISKRIDQQEQQWSESIASPLELLLTTAGPKLTTGGAGKTPPIPMAVVLAQLRSILDKRMDTMESLVQLTATETESSTKAVQERLNQDLLSQIVEAIASLPRPSSNNNKNGNNNSGNSNDDSVSSLDNIVAGDESVATSSYPTIYGDEDEDEDGQYQMPNTSSHSSSSEGRRGRSLGMDLVALDRQSSIRDIYGDIDIDDDTIAAEENTPDVRDIFAVSGRGKSLRDMCNIETIEEEDDESSQGSDVATRNDSSHSDVTARSLSVRHIYGDTGMDIDINNSDHATAGSMSHLHQSAPVISMTNIGQDTPPVMAKRSISVRTMTSSQPDDGTFHDVPFDDIPLDDVPLDDDEEEKADTGREFREPEGRKDRAPSLVARSASRKKDRPPSPVDRLESMRSVNSAQLRKKDTPPSPAGRVVSTRAIYGDAEIDDEAARTQHSLVYEGAENDDEAERAQHSSMYEDVDIDEHSSEDGDVDIDEEVAQTQHSTVSEQPSVFSYDDLDIDVGDYMESDVGRSSAHERSFASVQSEDLYDNLSIDGVDETRAFVDAADAAGESAIPTDASDDESDQLSVSIDGDSVKKDEESAGEEEEDDHLSVSIDGDSVKKDDPSGKEEDKDDLLSVSVDGESVQISVASGHDSDSSREDEEYFRDHERQHLSVLAHAMSRVRTAQKATRRYEKFQESFFTAQRDGPLALKVKSEGDDDDADDADDGGQSVATSDEASGDGSESGSALGQASDRDGGSSVVPSELSVQSQYDRSKQSAFIIAKAVAKRRAGNRAIRGYRRLLHQKFTPRLIRGPLALVENNSVNEVGGSSQRSDESASEVYLEEDRSDPVETSEHMTTDSFRQVDEDFDSIAPIPVSRHQQSPSTSHVRESNASQLSLAEHFEATNPADEGSSVGVHSTSTILGKESGHSLLEDQRVDDQQGESNHEGESVTSESRVVNTARSPPFLSPIVQKGMPVDDAFDFQGAPMATSTADSDPDDLWKVITVNSPRKSPGKGSPPRSFPHEAEAVEEEGACKPENLTKHPSRKRQPPEFHNEEEKKAGTPDREMKEWAATASPVAARIAPAVERNMGTGETKQEAPLVGSVLIIEQIDEMKAQMQKWQDVVSTASREMALSTDNLRSSNETLTASNESLQTNVQESIEDSHQFAEYIDKVLTERITQLEEVIRTQVAMVSQTLESRREQIVVQPATTSSPSRVRTGSAPPSPMSNTRTNGSPPRAIVNPFDAAIEEGGKEEEIEAKKVVSVAEWTRLQDQLRGTAEVAESYRKQVLQLRNVLEVKINEGNASQHQVELLQQKLQEAYDREIQAQKQLRPVTRRVEQVIQEMVQLEEHSASLQIENGLLREQLWMVQREF